MMAGVGRDILFLTRQQLIWRMQYFVPCTQRVNQTAEFWGDIWSMLNIGQSLTSVGKLNFCQCFVQHVTAKQFLLHYSDYRRLFATSGATYWDRCLPKMTMMMTVISTSMPALTLFVGQQQWHPACKNQVLLCCWLWFKSSSLHHCHLDAALKSRMAYPCL